MTEIGEDWKTKLRLCFRGLSHIGNMVIDDNKELRQSQPFLTSISMRHSPESKKLSLVKESHSLNYH